MPCENHKKALIRKITGDSNVEEAEKAADLVEISVLEDAFDQTIHGTNVSLWLQEIFDDATATVSSLDDGDRDNLMFNPQFVTYFLDVLRLLPLWSAICCQFFPGSEPIASTGNVESHIKVLKQSMEDVIPCSVDKFVQENMDMVGGLIIEASQNYIRFISDADRMEFDFTKEYTSNTLAQKIPHNEELELESAGDCFSEVRSRNEVPVAEDAAGNINKGIDNASTSSILVTEDNNFSSSDDGVDISREIISDIQIIRCPVCKDKNWPSGAHKCIICAKNVHIFPGCSVSIGGSEGYGEKRVCVHVTLNDKKETKTS